MPDKEATTKPTKITPIRYGKICKRCSKIYYVYTGTKSKLCSWCKEEAN